MLYDAPLDLMVGLVAEYNSVRVNTSCRSLNGCKQPDFQRNLEVVLFLTTRGDSSMSDKKKFSNTPEDNAKLLMHLNNRLELADELHAMSESEGVYKCFDGIATPIMQEIWCLAAKYLEGDFGYFHDPLDIDQYKKT